MLDENHFVGPELALDGVQVEAQLPDLVCAYLAQWICEAG